MSEVTLAPPHVGITHSSTDTVAHLTLTPLSGFMSPGVTSSASLLTVSGCSFTGVTAAAGLYAAVATSSAVVSNTTFANISQGGSGVHGGVEGNLDMEGGNTC